MLIKDGQALGLLGEVDTVIRQDRNVDARAAPPAALRVRPARGDDILKYAAAAEQRQSHPVATAIMHTGPGSGLSVPSIDEAEYRAGYGLSMTIDGTTVAWGRAVRKWKGSRCRRPWST